MPANEHTPIPTNASTHACVDLVNSSFSDYLGAGESVDRIGSRQWQQWFLDRHGLQPEPGEIPPVEDLIVLRRDLRRILEKWSTQEVLTARDVRHLDRRIRAAPFRDRLSVTSSGLAIGQEPLRRDSTWVTAAVAASAATLIATGDPKRLKTCGNSACSWMFYDNTVNRSKRFCSTTPCASLVRVRRFRARA
jgi:predicted RNA-binding Zn ribbon-like protein